MIIQEFYIKKYDWCVKVFYAVTHYDLDVVEDALLATGCRKKDIARARENLGAGYNHGLTYTNSAKRCSVVVVGLAENGAEYYNTIVHEQTHLVIHICKAYGIDYLSEELCYLAGEIAEKMYPKVKHIICDSCLERLKNFLSSFSL